MATEPRLSALSPAETGANRRRFLAAMAASGTGLAGVRMVHGRRPDDEEVPIVWRRDRFGEPETVRYIPRERYRRIQQFQDLSAGAVGDGINRLALTQQSDDPTDLALQVYVDERAGLPGTLPDEIGGMAVFTETRTVEQTTLGVCRERAYEFYDPLPANVGIEGYEGDDFVGNGTLGLVCWTAGEIEGDVDETDEDGESEDESEDSGDEGAGDNGGSEDDAEGAGDDGGSEDDDGDEAAADERDDAEDLTECYVTAAHIVTYEVDGELDGGVAEYLRHEGRADTDEPAAREEYVGSYQSHSSLGDEGLDVALYTHREDTVEPDPLANAASQLSDVAGAWTHEGLIDRTLEEALPVAYAGRSTCHAEMDCVEAAKGSLVEFEAVYSPNELTYGDSGGPILDDEGYLVGTAAYKSEPADEVVGPTGQELLDRLGAQLAGPDEEQDEE